MADGLPRLDGIDADAYVRHVAGLAWGDVFGNNPPYGQNGVRFNFLLTGKLNLTPFPILYIDSADVDRSASALHYPQERY